ncbi:CHASE2 domain-containing sensor protein [Polynucleobacter sphagniphilus]|jgi:hypothetical protein|uniref:CHASE2 domain-containing sensor protein n=1 Tax=Polynucleobacter sphagniphilus TaxID=1743169 RepID=A0AA43M6A5_9BURK|nr:CHASE2 domain-containing sensor protein [Polynucleobacter sphagniphilus]MDH6511602.1 CHASE2 domain-containing sensor protein [Polynucleobacter sphagniphilus]
MFAFILGGVACIILTSIVIFFEPILLFCLKWSAIILAGLIITFCFGYFVVHNPETLTISFLGLVVYAFISVYRFFQSFYKGYKGIKNE